MQPTPLRLQQAIWTAFKAAKPVTHANSRSSLRPAYATRPFKQWTQRARPQWSQHSLNHSRWYSDDIKPGEKQDIKDKIQDAHTKVNDAIESRADRSSMGANPLKQDETIIHTTPESSSIVYSPESPGQAAEIAAQVQAGSSAPDPIASTNPEALGDTDKLNETSQKPPAAAYSDRLPSHLKNFQSSTRHSFTHFMDNLQTHIFTASRRLNDLTGYTAIDQLKQDIESQEKLVRSCRQAVRDARHAYSSAVDNRSATQREVNDLLHRKHAWSPADLERFTNLYRSDHANEQAEQAAHQKLLETEKNYESASQRLSQGILARYHEEQIWSDKIRQMSTWGTWGLMGLNVLLFIVFQILIEPWRRRRLVRGFEDKVEEALRVRDERDILMVEAGRAAAAPALNTKGEATPVEVTAQAVNQAENIVAATLAESVASAVAGTDATQATKKAQVAIEAAAEDLTTAEVAQANPTEAAEIFEPVSDPLPTSSFQPLNETPFTQIPATFLSNLSIASQQYQAHIKSFFDGRTGVIMTRREYTTSVLESACIGALGMACVFWLAGVGAR